MTEHTFNPAKHGPAIWKLQGIKWTDKELPNARIFKDWTAAKLAPVLGLEVSDVAAVLAGPAAPAPVARGITFTAPLPVVGSTWDVTRRHPYFLHAGTQGFTTDPEAAASMQCWHFGRGDVVKVWAAGPAGALVQIYAEREVPARLILVPLATFARIFKGGQMEGPA